MRFATFEPEAGVERFGFTLGDDRIVDLEGATAAMLAKDLPIARAYDMAASLAPADAHAFLQGGDRSLDAARMASAHVEDTLQRQQVPHAPYGEDLVFALENVTIKAPIPRPRNFIASGKNFQNHLTEMQQSNDPVVPRIPSGHPQYGSAVVGTGVTVPIPKETKRLDYEVEMAMVIGRPAYRISREEAFDYIFGYTVYNDLSARDTGEQRWGVPMMAKNLPGFAPMGPWIVTKDEIDDIDQIGLYSRVNGEPRQINKIENMRFKIADQVAFWSQIGLEPGDIVTTGTPGGVAAGRRPGETEWWLKPGDVVECEVDKVGTLVTYIG